MNELIKIELRRLNGEEIQTVNARDLHAFLGSKQDFSTWIKSRIEQYGFIENQDFVVFHEIMENPQGGRPAKEYFITLDMAKELAMVERTEQGQKARRYFIECERRYLSGERIGQSKPAQPLLDALKLTPLAVRAAKALGLDKNAAAISANQLVRKYTSVNVLEALGQTHLVAEKQDTLFFTPSQLGKRIGMSAQKVNQRLASLGLQEKIDELWSPTNQAEGFYRLYDTGKRHGNGVPVMQVKWSDGVLNLFGEQESVA